MANNAKAGSHTKKRAIALAGGGPAAGLHIGVLSALEKRKIKFDVWSLSCIGAWVGIYYNQVPDNSGRAEKTLEFFREHAFRDTGSYQGFPVNRAFAPHLQAFANAWMQHSLSPQTYLDVFNLANELPTAAKGWLDFLSSPGRWLSEGDRNGHVLNNMLAVNPVSRFITSVAYLSGINGLSNIYFKDSSLLKGIDLPGLDLTGEDLDHKSPDELIDIARNYALSGVSGKKTPEIYHNAWRLADKSNGSAVSGQIQLFNNKWVEYRLGMGRPKRDYLPVTRPSLCACSALPYIEQTVQIPNDNNHHYSEGALVDTVNFRNLVEDHPDLDEIWVCRIVDDHQVKTPKNLHDSLGNLCEQFAAEVGQNDISLFKNHMRKTTGRIPRIVEIPLDPKTSKVNYRWDHANLEQGYQEGRDAVHRLLDKQSDLEEKETSTPAWPKAAWQLGVA